MCAFVTGVGSALRLRTGRRSVCNLSTPRVRVAPRVRMGVGEDGLKEDLDFARGCIEEGCAVDAVQSVLTRLEQRRAVLSLEVSQIEEVMATLAKENLGGNRSLVAEAMEAAVAIFAKSEDNYPATGNPQGYTMDPLKKQPKF